MYTLIRDEELGISHRNFCEILPHYLFAKQRKVLRIFFPVANFDFLSNNSYKFYSEKQATVFSLISAPLVFEKIRIK